MNKIREIVKEQGRTLVWLAGKISPDDKPISRSLMDWKIDHDSFEDWQRDKMVAVLGVPVETLFPDVSIEGVVA